MPSRYEVLGLTPEASEEEVRRAFKTLAQIYHHDRYTEASKSVQEESSRRMKEITVAYQTLLDDLKKDVVYRTKGWTNRRKGDVTEKLLDAGVPHSWDREFLTIPRKFKEVGDQTVLHGPPIEPRRVSTPPPPDTSAWDVTYTVEPQYIAGIVGDLEHSQIPHTWERNELTVPRPYERAVDEIVARRTGTGWE